MPSRSTAPRLADAGGIGDDDRQPSRSRRTSITSRVVPASSETIAASRRASAFRRLDLPTLGGPASTTRKPSRRISPRWPSSRCARDRGVQRLRHRRACAKALAARRPRRRSRWPPRSARCASISSRAPALVAVAPARPPVWRRAWRRCASVSASIRSARPSAWAGRACRSRRRGGRTRRARPAGNRRLRRAPPAGRTTARPPCTCSSAMSSPVSLWRREPQHQAAIEHLARRGMRALRAARPMRGSGPRRRHASRGTSRPPARKCAPPRSPARPGALESAKMVVNASFHAFRRTP